MTADDSGLKKEQTTHKQTREMAGLGLSPVCVLTTKLFAVTAVWFQCLQLGVLSAENASGGVFEADEMYRQLWLGYQSAVRPVCPSARWAPTTVSLGLALRQLQGVDEPKQILAANIWLRVNWSECRLMWNRTRWNISRLTVPHKTMWTPDLTLYDNAESGLTGVETFRLIVDFRGQVTQQVPVVIKSVCQLDVSRFPFDTQTCTLTFGSWAYNGHEVNLTLNSIPVDLTSYVTHGEWQLVGVTAHRNEPVFAGVPYPQIAFEVVLQRRHLFYVLSIIFPGAMIQMMAGLAFLLPSATGEKVGLEITVLLSLAVLQLVILDMVPASSETLPLIGVYYTLAMVVVALSCLMTVAVLAVHYPHRHYPLPPWAWAVLTSRLARCLRVDASSIQPSKKANAVDPDVSATTSSSSNRKKEGSSRDMYVSTVEMTPVSPSLNATTNTAASGPARVVGNGMIATEQNTLNLDSTAGSNLDVRNENGVGRINRLEYERNSRDINLSYSVVEGERQIRNRNADKRDKTISDQREISLNYSAEGERNTRVCLRPLSADERQLTQILSQGGAGEENIELQEAVEVCRQILDVLNGGKKNHDDKMSGKQMRRQWELMAVFLDRVFLLTFLALSLTVFLYIFTSIA